jgi:hypothetical protein
MAALLSSMLHNTHLTPENTTFVVSLTVTLVQPRGFQ